MEYTRCTIRNGQIGVSQLPTVKRGRREQRLKKLISMLLIAGLLAALTGCGGKGKEEPTSAGGGTVTYVLDKCAKEFIE